MDDVSAVLTSTFFQQTFPVRSDLLRSIVQRSSHRLDGRVVQRDFAFQAHSTKTGHFGCFLRRNGSTTRSLLHKGCSLKSVRALTLATLASRLQNQQELSSR